jgi:hypothetical protein
MTLIHIYTIHKNCNNHVSCWCAACVYCWAVLVVLTKNNSTAEQSGAVWRVVEFGQIPPNQSRNIIVYYMQRTNLWLVMLPLGRFLEGSRTTSANIVCAQMEILEIFHQTGSWL